MRATAESWASVRDGTRRCRHSCPHPDAGLALLRRGEEGHEVGLFASAALPGAAEGDRAAGACGPTLRVGRGGARAAAVAFASTSALKAGVRPGMTLTGDRAGAVAAALSVQARGGAAGAGGPGRALMALAPGFQLSEPDGCGSTRARRLRRTGKRGCARRVLALCSSTAGGGGWWWPRRSSPRGRWPGMGLGGWTWCRKERARKRWPRCHWERWRARSRRRSRRSG